MKKAKIMLLGITIMAVVGGVLAFKAKTYGQLFCTRLIENGPGICECSYIGKIDVVNGNSYYYTRTDDPTKCKEAPCTSTTSLTDIE